MIRCKWLRLESTLAPAKVVKAVLSRRFSDEVNGGFLGILKLEKSVAAKYAERAIVRESSINPYGEISESESVRYSIVSFRLHFGDPFDENYLLEVFQPPRTLRPLLQELSEALGGVVVHEPNIQLLSLYKDLKKNAFKAKIVKLKAAGIAISSTSELRAEVLSSDDAYGDLISHFDESKFKLEKVKIENPFPAKSGPLELRTNGLCSFDECVEEDVRHLLLTAYRREFSASI